MNQFHCSLSNGTTLSYDQTKNPNLVISTLGSFTKILYVDGFFYDQDSHLSLIEVTGHKPSAGPVIDPWETSYSMRFAGSIPTGTAATIKGEIYKNVAYTGWVLMPATATCNVLIERTF
jgi:hypothetical protein